MGTFWKQADEEGRYPLSHREYQAIRALFGSQNSLINAQKDLENRIRVIPDGWRDFRLVYSVLEKLLTKLLRTVPSQKLLSMKRELKDTYCEVKVKGAAGQTLEGDLLRVVPQQDLETVVNAAMDFRCFACDRCDYKKCRLYQAINNLYHYDFPKSKTCPLSDETILTKEDYQ